MGLFKKVVVNKPKEEEEPFDEDKMNADIEAFSTKVKDFVEEQSMGDDSEGKNLLDEESQALRKKWGIRAISIEIGITVTAERRQSIPPKHMPKRTLKKGSEEHTLFEKEKGNLQASLDKALERKNRKKGRH